ncbi:MAG TPA: alpha/beta fold hydrolase, partial [Gemmatimonadaceae bacterium]|nr:alpha/beta fold hydrolase [Gemmatimonadaceae bacterium]
MSEPGRVRRSWPGVPRLDARLELQELAGRLPASEMYPAHDHRVAARMLALPSGIHVRVVEAGPCDGRPVVLLHGWGAGAYTYRHNLPALADAGLRATAVELKGHGLSEKPSAPGEYAFGAMLGHVHEVLAALR